MDLDKEIQWIEIEIGYINWIGNSLEFGFEVIYIYIYIFMHKNARELELDMDLKLVHAYI